MSQGTFQVVWFLDRRAVRLGLVRPGERGRGAVLVDDQGETHRWKDGKALHTLAERVRDPGQAPAVRDRLRRLAADLAGPGPTLAPAALDAALDAALEDGRRYALAEVAAAALGAGDDRGVARLVAALGAPTDGWIGHGLRLEQGAVVRLDAAARGKIRAQREAEARRKAADDALVAWVEARPGPGGLADPPPGDVASDLEGLVAFALAGDLAPDAAAARRLARRLGHDGPDALLAALERGGAVPAHVNEQPRRHGVPVEHGAAAVDEARRLVEAGAATGPRGALDLRGRPTLAIDEEGTREVDDALSLWEADGATWLAVTIARAGDVVTPGGALDREARRRGTTVYFADGSIPMLPHALVEGRLSLDEGQERAGLSLVARVLPGGRLEGARFTTSVVRVTRALPYDAWAEGGPDGEALACLLPVAHGLREARLQRGATILSLPFLKLRAHHGAPVARVARNDAPAQVVVSELMVLYNAELGRALAAAGAPALFRTQPRPVKRPARDPHDPLYPAQARRGLPPTLVEVVPGPHRMLGLEAYVQGTSPIRRYGDLLAQRQLLALLEGRPPAHDRAEVEALRGEVEVAEKRAGRAQDDRERYWLAVWLAAHPGPHEAHVSRVDDRGGAQVYLPALDREYPVSAGRALAVGERVEVRVAAAAPRARTVALEVVTPPAGA